MWTIFKVFIEFVTILFLIYGLIFWLRGMWDLSSDQGSKLHPLHWKVKVTQSCPTLCGPVDYTVCGIV